jgi:hypothetical protein
MRIADDKRCTYACPVGNNTWFDPCRSSTGYWLMDRPSKVGQRCRHDNGSIRGDSCTTQLCRSDKQHTDWHARLRPERHQYVGRRQEMRWQHADALDHCHNNSSRHKSLDEANAIARSISRTRDLASTTVVTRFPGPTVEIATAVSVCSDSVWRH